MKLTGRRPARRIPEMMTLRLKTILMSAYISAMLASSVSPLRSDATLASAIDPMAAQKALQSAVSGLDAAGWSPIMASGPSAASQPSYALAGGGATLNSDPIISEELMGRLIKRTLAAKKDSKINKPIAGIFGLNDGSEDLPAKQISFPSDEVKHTVIVCTKEGSSDIVIGVMRGDINEIYLIDKTGKLRAASIWDTTGIRLITNEQAVSKFNLELAFLAKEAAGLPPTGTSVASNG
jgi:hypothetical protein